ncbi:MAG: hypothetical protein AAGF84_12735 [Planctomycetota bacterium]
MNTDAAVRLFGCVTLGALVGMAMGGAFGAAAGRLAPGFFAGLMPFGPGVENPAGTAIMIGAAGGVCCGGALAAFALVLVRIDAWLRLRARSHQAGTG